MDRNRVIIDGSNGTAAHPCPSAAAQQDFTPRDGIVVSKTSGVTIQNLTVCDYLAGDGDHGNEIWWNGGDGTGTIGLGAYSGSYLTATSEWAPAKVNSPQLAQYGIFVSNSTGPGLITNSYASNMADAAYYVGGCRRICNMTLANDTGVNSALGYSGTNAGGQLIIKNSLFRDNRAGIAPNSENNDDAPPPQDGRCPGSATKSCMIIEGNTIQGNNNANAPGNGAVAPVGTGIQIVGGEYDTVARNVIEDQGAWGILISDNADPEKPPPGTHCQGGIMNKPLSGFCLFQARGNLVYSNVFSGVGKFGNPSNSDLATETLGSYTPRNCFYGNVDLGGPADLRARQHPERERGRTALRAGWHPKRSGADQPAHLRDRVHQMPGAAQSGEVPEADPHRDDAAAPASEHADPLRGRAEERVLPLTRAWLIRVMRSIGGTPVHRINHEAPINHANRSGSRGWPAVRVNPGAAEADVMLPPGHRGAPPPTGRRPVSRASRRRRAAGPGPGHRPRHRPGCRASTGPATT